MGDGRRDRGGRGPGSPGPGSPGAGGRRPCDGGGDRGRPAADRQRGADPEPRPAGAVALASLGLAGGSVFSPHRGRAILSGVALVLVCWGRPGSSAVAPAIAHRPIAAGIPRIAAIASRVTAKTLPKILAASPRSRGHRRGAPRRGRARARRAPHEQHDQDDPDTMTRPLDPWNCAGQAPGVSGGDPRSANRMTRPVPRDCPANSAVPHALQAVTGAVDGARRARARRRCRECRADLVLDHVEEEVRRGPTHLDSGRLIVVSGGMNEAM